MSLPRKMIDPNSMRVSAHSDRGLLVVQVTDLRSGEEITPATCEHLIFPELMGYPTHDFWENTLAKWRRALDRIQWKLSKGPFRT